MYSKDVTYLIDEAAERREVRLREGGEDACSSVDTYHRAVSTVEMVKCISITQVEHNNHMRDASCTGHFNTSHCRHLDRNNYVLCEIIGPAIGPIAIASVIARFLL